MLASATQSPGFTPMLTPLMRSPLESPSHSRSHSPTSISLSLYAGGGGAANGGGKSTNGGGLPSGRYTVDSRRNSQTTLSHGGPHHEYNEPTMTNQKHAITDDSSRVMFHVDGYNHLLSSSLPASGNTSVNPSRSNTPPLNEGFPPTNYPAEHLAAFTEILFNGISTSNDVKKKDNHGKTYQNCFTGKEAVNCLRPRLPKNAMVSQECMSLLQQLLQEGFILEAQSVEDLNKQIAAKFTDKDGKLSSARNSPKLQSLQSSLLRSESPAHALAFKVPSDIGGVLPPPGLIFRKDALYQLSTKSTANATLPPSLVQSHSSSGYTSPIPSSGTGLLRWYENYSGTLGKKRENKGLGNSLALGLGVSTFQKRFFVCSAKEQAVVYYKEEPPNDQERPLGFIPFSEILFVDHLQSATNQLTASQSRDVTPTLSRSNSFSKHLSGAGGASGSSTPPVTSSSSSSEEKAGRLFDIVASFRVYHLQAESTMEAMKWVQAIKESLKEAALHRAERLATNGVVASSQPTFGPGGTMRAPLVRTPRTPEHSKRFWSNVTHPSVNPSTFPVQHLKQVLRDDQREQLNGLYGKRIRPQRVSHLRRHFFELNFSISALNQASYFDQLLSDFPSDGAIVELAFNLVMKGAAMETDPAGPKSFRSHVLAPDQQAHFVTPLHQPIAVGASGTSSAAGGSGQQQQQRQYVDASASTLLLAKANEIECDDREEPEPEEEEDEDEDAPEPVEPRRQHRRSISCSALPDLLGRVKPKRTRPPMEAEILRARLSESREYSRSSSTSTSTSTRSNGVRTKRTHRRHHSDLCPLASTTHTKYGDFAYHLLNKYALYFSAACKLPKAGTPAALEPVNLLNAPHLYRIYHPYKRLESWLHTDAFLTLVLNDEALINEVPLALPLVWAILQWRNHDSDPHTIGGGGFVDDACLRKNWMEETVDGEDDGFTGGAQGASEEEESTLVASKENAVKAGFKSVARAHLRVNSFSTMADPLSAIRSAPPVASPQPQASSTCPSSPLVTSPVVYGQHGQIVAGMGARGSMVGSHHHAVLIGGGVHSQPSTPLLSAHQLNFAQSPASPSFSEYNGPDQSPLSPMTPLMTAQAPGMLRSVSSPGEETHSGETHSGAMMSSPQRTLPPRAPMTTPPHRSQASPGTPMSPFPIARQWPTEEEKENSVSLSSDEPGAARGQRNSNSEQSDQSEVGSMVQFHGSAPSTRRNSFVGTGTATGSGSKRSSAGGTMEFQPTVSFATASATAPSSKRGSLEPIQGGLASFATVRTAPSSGASSPMRRERGTIIQTGQTIRPPNLLTGGAGAGTYQTLRHHHTLPPPPTIPLELPHWKVRSLVACKFCFQSALEFMQAIQERYGMDAGRAEHARACKVAHAAGRRAPRAHPSSKFTISVSNTLFSLLLTPLYSLSSLSSGDYSSSTHNPVLQDSFNVLGKCIVSPHLWPTLLACLQSNQTTCSEATAPFLKHHVLKDLNTLFIGSNLACNNRNCRLLFKFFTHTARQEFHLLADAWAEQQREKKMSDRQKEKAERRRKRVGPQIMIGAWQKGLLNLLRNHVPMRGGRYPSIRDVGIERLHSKIYQYTLNLFGVFHFYKFQCIGGPTNAPINVHLAANSKAALAAEEKAMMMTSCADFENLFRESFWRAMHLHRQAHADQQKQQAAEAAAGDLDDSESSHGSGEKRSSTSSARSSPTRVPVGGVGGGARRSSVDMRHLDHTVARSMLTTMLQRLIFKIKSKTCNLDQRWPAVAFLLQQVKSFVFSAPFKPVPGVGTPVPAAQATSAGALSKEAILGLELDFAPGSESLHQTALSDDVDLLEKALELLRALRLYQELDGDAMSLAKQREVKLHVEKESHASKGRVVDLHDPASKLKLNSAHEDLAHVYAHLIPTDQASLRFLQQSVAFLKDSVCFLAMMQQPRAQHMEPKEVHQLVARFVTMDRREKVFCATKHK